MKPIILYKCDAPHIVQDLSRDFTLLEFDLAAGRPDAAACQAARVFITTGVAGASRAEIAALPALGLICTVGTGYEHVDLDAARERGIPVTHAAGVNAPSVADHAFALLLAAVRDIPARHTAALGGAWRDSMSARPLASGKRMGIIGMGAIGRALARRAEGFDMTVAYMARAPKPDLPWRFFDNAEALAADSDFLIAAVPGGAATHHLINRQVLRALGPKGFVVNVGRGSVVGTEDLVAALKAGEIAGAGLDVFEDEPGVPAILHDLPNLVVSPHIAGTAAEIRVLSAALMRKNVEAFFAGRPLATPVPEMAG